LRFGLHAQAVRRLHLALSMYQMDELIDVRAMRGNPAIFSSI
jgi:hypothetical protein